MPNKKEMAKLKKTQSMLEYIFVSIVFATVGFVTIGVASFAINEKIGLGSFFNDNHQDFLAFRGTDSTYSLSSTAIGRTLEDGVEQDTLKWPSTFDTNLSNPDDLPINEPQEQELLNLAENHQKNLEENMAEDPEQAAQDTLEAEPDFDEALWEQAQDQAQGEGLDSGEDLDFISPEEESIVLDESGSPLPDDSGSLGPILGIRRVK